MDLENPTVGLKGICCFMRVLTSFDLWSILGLTRGIFVILVGKDTLGAPMSERVAPHHSGCSRNPMERK